MKNLGDVFQLSQGSKTQTSGFALRLILCCKTVCRDAWTDIQCAAVRREI